MLTGDFWTIRLPDDFITSSTSASPAYQAYIAALNILDADLFALDEKVRDWMDPSAGALQGIEAHHLYPRAHLRDIGITETKRINQVANYAPTDWSTNNLIAGRAPSKYWPDLVADRKLVEDVLKRQRYWHALPENWAELEYSEFLELRRHAMATVARDGFGRLADPTYEPQVEGITPTPSTAEEEREIASLNDLLDAGLLNPGELLVPVDPERDTIAEVTEEGVIVLDDRSYSSPHRAARADGDEHSDGWDYWMLAEREPPCSLRSLAESIWHQEGGSGD